MSIQPSHPNGNLNRTLDLLKQLFVHRQDCYWTQNPEHKFRLVKDYSNDTKGVDVPVSDALLLRHLTGLQTVGVPIICNDSTVRVMVFDFDDDHFKDESAKQACSKVLSYLREKLKIRDKHIVLEASRYPSDNYHLWVLFDEAYPAKYIKTWGLKILKECGYIKNGHPDKVELFPDGEGVTKHTPYGKYCKLPFGFNQKHKLWSRMLDLDSWAPQPIDLLWNKQGLTLDWPSISLLRQCTEQRLSQRYTRVNTQIFQAPKVAGGLTDRGIKCVVDFWGDGFVVGQRQRFVLALCGYFRKRGIDYRSCCRVVEVLCERSGATLGDCQEFLDVVYHQYFVCVKPVDELLGIGGLKALKLDGLVV
ncbi:MAG: hypothetical protein LBI79_10535 [Nitrososphaerota archaeon]|nr:hypothetical protein [Nitrososphaerota archaeon]